MQLSITCDTHYKFLHYDQYSVKMVYTVQCIILVPHWVTSHLMSYYKYQEAFLWFVPVQSFDGYHALSLKWNEKKSMTESNQ